MKTRRQTIAFAGGVVLASLAVAQSGGSYDLRWNTQDGGGGRMSGAGYEMNGTIGQPEASPQGAMSGGGGLTVYGGFWIGPGMSAIADVIFRDGFGT